METKNFFEVFPGLRLEKETGGIWRKVQVKRVALNQDKTLLRVYIDSEHLIQKAIIYKVEEEMKQQLFQKMDMRVKLVEFYRLSSQYTPAKLLNIYKDSILLELKNYSAIEHNLFLRAECKFPEEQVLQLLIEDSMIAREKSGELKRILEKIFTERCGFPLEVRIGYKEKKEKSRFEEEKKLVIRQEAASTTVKETVDEKKAVSLQSQPVLMNHKKETKDTAVKSKREGSRRPLRKSDHPDVFYGRDVEEDAIELVQITDEMGEVTIRGKILNVDTREIRGEKTIVIFDVTDFTDTITVKIFLHNDQKDEVLSEIAKGRYIKIKGFTTIDRFDGELTISSVVGMKRIPDFTTRRMDNTLKKRVELHCHTKMSDMDGVSSAEALIKRAISWGHPALAITDHGVAQAFPEAYHAIQKLEWEYKDKGEELDFKIIYGVEAYLVDDLKDAVVNSRNQSLDDTYVVFDLETTGFSPIKDKIIEIGAVKLRNGEIIDTFSTFVNPQIPIPFRIEELTGINDSMVVQAPSIEKILPEFLGFCGEAVMVAHNADFDMSFIEENSARIGLQRKFTVADTVALARILLPSMSRFKLDTVAKALRIPLDNHHRAVDDATCTAKIFLKFIDMLRARDADTLDAVNRLSKASPDNIKKLPTHHAIILACNETGREHLYRLISDSHINYYHRRPRIPKSEYQKYKEGLLIGSACEAGELYQAIVSGRSEEEITRLVNFYDYLEIQPTGNNMFMLRSDKYSLSTVKELEEINRRIVKLGEAFGKPVVATCDVHFLDPQDEVYRRIIMAGKGFDDADQQAPLFLRTTEEMLKEFEYLGSKVAEEVVIHSTNKISGMIEKMDPVRPDKCPPVIEDSDKLLRKICYEKAHSMYGPELPDIVTERLERELNSIISNGFAVMYIIAQKLVWKSNEDGYLVGSRGSVGSSFVATMAGITEVNPLSPHYYCDKCYFSDFNSPEVRKFAGGSGCDMPDRLCPNCGEALIKDGFDIPFETFLGFKGNKEPDIDLNFSGEYQNHAHDYTEVIFGKGQTFRAGTIGTLAEKTAYGYVKKYYEERGIRKRKCEISRLAHGCEGIRRSTGQHPGGIIVLPHGYDINSFTPVQRPANDMKTKTVTTHFDYHSIDHNLLKLDILGHDDPTMIRMLEDLTGVDAKSISLDDKKVMSLFESTQALGIRPEDIGGCKLGALGIPEFGTEFVIQMLLDTKPKTFSDLVRISGLSHGTDVWLGNAQTLIEEGKATISTAICTRDDIMVYLINQGMDKELSFTIMESVRKGKGLKKEWEEAMKDAGVPEWYIWSCKKIQYMFPKAHAAAYVMMAFRIAYFKVYYPLAYYAAFFSIRASSFNYELMCQGKEKLAYFMQDYQKRMDTLSNKELDTWKDMKIVQEMYARGFEFLPIDIYQAKANRFQIIDNKLMPALSTIDGLGDKAADAVVEAAKNGRFLSKDDFRNRTKVSKTVIELMTDLNILTDLPETNQLSLFDSFI